LLRAHRRPVSPCPLIEEGGKLESKSSGATRCEGEVVFLVFENYIRVDLILWSLRSKRFEGWMQRTD
jgi:hypothetical protein